jgi:hypothetical protein
VNIRHSCTSANCLSSHSTQLQLSIISHSTQLQVKKYGEEPKAEAPAARATVASPVLSDEAPAARATAGSPQVSAPIVSAEPESVKARLARFYSKYLPDKLNDEQARTKLLTLEEVMINAFWLQINAALQRFAGKESQMFEVLVRKYGPEVSS